MKNNNLQGGSKLGRFSLLTLVAIYFLILVGGIVRSTGSGMGCPDWPKCFGSWIPPTEISQLPPNYKEIYSEKRALKNERLVSYLYTLGLKQTADRISNDQSILEEADFNATKTWIEYINRLIGVVIGLLIIGTVFFSLKYIRIRPSLFVLALSSLILVIIQGWIGSLVVSTNLIPFMVTFHMLLALLIVALLCAIVVKANSNLSVFIEANKFIKPMLVLAMLAMLAQVVFGTQVREAIDVVAASLTARANWIESLGIEFIIHRSFSWVVLFINAWVLFQLYRVGQFNTTSRLLSGVIVLTILSGTAMAYLGVPAFIQPVHLLLGTLGFGLQFFLFLQLETKGSFAA